MGALLQLVSGDRHSTAAGFVVKLVDKRSASRQTPMRLDALSRCKR
jgi:hypothetical protein